VNDRDAAVLEDLFLLGYTTSNAYTIYKDEKFEIRVQFRTVLPYELREIANLVHLHSSPLAQIITEQLETLARAIVTINGFPLILSNHEREEFKARNRRDPSPLDQARIILTEKVKSEHILDAMWDAYREFTQEIAKNFDDVKKKLKGISFSDSTSP
jgi:hypothetical protein